MGLAVLAVPAIGEGEWETLEDVPIGTISGVGLVYAASSIWGIFPDPDLEEEDAYLWRFDCETDEWDECPVEEVGDILEYSAITWQPGLSGSGVIWWVGNACEDPVEPTLFWYDIDEEELYDEEVTGLTFGPGVSPAHGDAWYPSWVQQIELNVGWLHCLEGGSVEFWRYGIPVELDAPEEDSIYPPDSSAVHDPTPPFKWSAPDSTYRLLVATDENFNDVVIDQTVSTSNYDPSTALDDGQYFWKVGTNNGLGSYTWSQVRIFWQGSGWVQLEDLPGSATSGAALAYDNQDYYLTQSPIGFRGGVNVNYYRYEFDDVASDWTTQGMHTTPHQQLAGTSLATPQDDADYAPPWAIFGGNSTFAYWHHWRYGWDAGGNALPESPGDGASIAYAHHDDQDYLYMVCGSSSTGFYRLPIEYEGEGGGESRGSVPIAMGARVVGRANEQALQYTLDADGPVRVTLCDVSGRIAATLCSGSQEAGQHELCWNPRTLGLHAGAYIVALDAGPQQARLKVIVR